MYVLRSLRFTPIQSHVKCSYSPPSVYIPFSSRRSRTTTTATGGSSCTQRVAAPHTVSTYPRPCSCRPPHADGHGSNQTTRTTWEHEEHPARDCRDRQACTPTSHIHTKSTLRRCLLLQLDATPTPTSTHPLVHTSTADPRLYAKLRSFPFPTPFFFHSLPTSQRGFPSLPSHRLCRWYLSSLFPAPPPVHHFPSTHCFKASLSRNSLTHSAVHTLLLASRKHHYVPEHRPPSHSLEELPHFLHPNIFLRTSGDYFATFRAAESLSSKSVITFS